MVSAQSQPIARPRPEAAAPVIRIEGVSRRFGDHAAVAGVDLTIRRGEFFSLLGASGSGKTTLLRMLAGFEQPDEGRIIIDGVDMAGVPPYARPVNMMFQSYALFPHMTVEQNVAFGLKQEKLPRAEIGERVRAVLDLVQMGSFRGRKPHQLSGGQRQRVALARCLAKQPKVLLLDEPLAALDRKLREKTQLELVNLQDRLGITFVMVTHDQDEAMTMSSRIAVMDGGRIEQVGTPVEIYEYPATRHVAEFIGNGNFFDGEIAGRRGEHTLILVPDLGSIDVANAAPLPEGAAVTVMVRPEKMGIGRQAPEGAHNSASGVVRDIVYLGDISIFHVRLDCGRLVQVSMTNLRHTAERRITWEDRVQVWWHPANAVMLAR